MLWLVVLFLCAVLFYVKFVRPLSYWQKRNVVHDRSMPVLGVFGPPLFGRASLPEAVQDIYNKHENESFVGYNQFNQPVLLIRDLDMIKEITVKNSDSFIDRQPFFDIRFDPLLHKSLFFQNGGDWKDMRVRLSPSFTSNKMKSLFGLMTECAERFTDHFENKIVSKVSIEAKDAFRRLTMDVIATCAFGVTPNSIKDENNEFYSKGKMAASLSNFKFAFFGSCSLLVKMFKLRFIAKPFADYFANLIKQTIKIREENNTTRPDMLHLLIEAKNKRGDETTNKINKTVTNDDIVPQAFIFFLGGLETVSTMCTFTVYELACNVDIQEKMQREIDETLRKCGGKLTYEALMEMPYLDMVISESMRKWPPMDQMFRNSVGEYTLRGKNSKQVKLEPGTTVIISGFCIHRDPKNFPNPEVFDPERFSAENKSSIPSYAYLPFGAGPRNCIGSRFSLLAAKVLLVHILSKFSFTVTEKTQIPLKLSKKSFTMLPEKGAWLGLEKRSR